MRLMITTGYTIKQNIIFKNGGKVQCKCIPSWCHYKLQEMSGSSKEASGMKSHGNSDLTENACQKERKNKQTKNRSLSVIFTLSLNNSTCQSLFTLTANCNIFAVQVPGADSGGRAVSIICALLPQLQLCENTSTHWNGKHRVTWSVLCLPSLTTDWNNNVRTLQWSTKNMCFPEL